MDKIRCTYWHGCDKEAKFKCICHTEERNRYFCDKHMNSHLEIKLVAKSNYKRYKVKLNAD